MARYNVLFLCTGNSARSIMAEAIMSCRGMPNFTAYSAGSHPSGFVRPEAIRQIEAARMSTANLRSKSWDEFSGPDCAPAPLCLHGLRQRSQEVCPYWPGQPMTAHWGIPDPAAVTGNTGGNRPAPSPKPSSLSIAASASSSACRWQRWTPSPCKEKSTTSESNRSQMRLLIIGGSDAGISAALRAHGTRSECRSHRPVGG